MISPLYVLHILFIVFKSITLLPHMPQTHRLAYGELFGFLFDNRDTDQPEHRKRDAALLSGNKVKKTSIQTHRFMIDVYPADKPLDKIKTDVMAMDHSPGTLGCHRQVVADGMYVTVTSDSEAIHTFIALHYVQHVGYKKQVKMAFMYMEQELCGCPRVGYKN